MQIFIGVSATVLVTCGGQGNRIANNKLEFLKIHCRCAVLYRLHMLCEVENERNSKSKWFQKNLVKVTERREQRLCEE